MPTAIDTHRRAGHCDAGNLLVGHVEEIASRRREIEIELKPAADADVEQNVVRCTGSNASAGWYSSRGATRKPAGSGIAIAAVNDCGA